MVVEAAPEGLTPAGVLERLEDRPAHRARRRRYDADPGGVDHVEHLLHAFTEVTDWPREGAAQAHLRRGQAFVPEAWA